MKNVHTKNCKLLLNCDKRPEIFAKSRVHDRVMEEVLLLWGGKFSPFLTQSTLANCSLTSQNQFNLSSCHPCDQATT